MPPGRPAGKPVLRAALAAIGALPWLVTAACAAFPGAATARLDALYAASCARAPERTLALLGCAMPVCSRCAGVYAGLALGALLARPALPARRARPALAAAAALAALDVLLQDTGVHAVWHPARLATGCILGYVLALAMIGARPAVS